MGHAINNPGLLNAHINEAYNDKAETNIGRESFLY